MLSFYQLFNRPNLWSVKRIQIATNTVCAILLPIFTATTSMIERLPPEPPDFFLLNLFVRLITLACTILYLLITVCKFTRALL